MTTATRERIERIAQQQVEPYGTSSVGELVRGHVISALTALCEEMEREKQRSSLDRNSSEHKNCDSTCQECT